jgi:predicted nucleic acid-binding protein
LRTAYLDTNVVSHIFARHELARPEWVDQFQLARRDGRLLAPASVVVSEELLGSGDAALCRSYLELCSLECSLKPSGLLLREACEAFARSVSIPSPFWSPKPRELVKWIALMEGKNRQSDVERVRDKARKQVDDFLAFIREQKGIARDALPKTKAGRLPTFEEFWAEECVLLARHFAERNAVLAEVDRRGIEGLLAQGVVLASAGYGAALEYQQIAMNRAPNRGDSRDMQSLVMAAAACDLLVTHDGRFAERIRMIPGLEVKPCTLEELVRSL